MKSFEKLELKHGPLRFTALTEGSGPLVLCLHGFPDSARSYRSQLPALAQAGYRAVSVTLRGYEPASIPADGDYSHEAIAGDMIAIIDQLEEERVHLIGHDWGAIKGYVTAARSPERFKSLTAIAVPHIGRLMSEMPLHPKQLAMSWYVFFFQLRGISDYAVRRNNYSFIRMLWRRWSPGWQPPEEELLHVINGLRQPGVTRATLDYYRDLISLRSIALTGAARKKAAFKVPVPTMALTGERCGCVDSDLFKTLMLEEDFPEGLNVRQIANAGHFPHQEQPETVNPLIVEWLAQHEHRV